MGRRERSTRIGMTKKWDACSFIRFKAYVFTVRMWVKGSARQMWRMHIWFRVERVTLGTRCAHKLVSDAVTSYENTRHDEQRVLDRHPSPCLCLDKGGYASPRCLPCTVWVMCIFAINPLLIVSKDDLITGASTFERRDVEAFTLYECKLERFQRR